MADVLITGGAGFIGSHLAAAAVARGLSVRVLDDFSTGRPENLAGIPVEIVRGDVRDWEAVRLAVRGTRWVFHEAAMTSVPLSVQDPLRADAVNARGTLHVLQAAREAGVSRVVLASSAALYGSPDGSPSPEACAGGFLSPYAASKWIGEEYARLFHALYGLETVSLRYFNVYGPRQDPGSAYASVIPIFASALLRGEGPVINGDGRQTRDFIYVEDVVLANLLAAEAPGVGGMSFNVATGSSCSIVALWNGMAAGREGAPAPRFGPPRAGDVPASLADVSLARDRLGFRARVSLVDGLARTVDWYRTSGALR